MAEFVEPGGGGPPDEQAPIPGGDAGPGDGTSPDRPTPGGKGTAAAGGAGAAGGGIVSRLGSGGLSTLLKRYGAGVIWLPVIAWLTSERNWLRVLEFVGGAVMIGIAMREFARG